MSAVAVGLIAFGLILASIAIGLMMRRWVPEAHISGDSKEVIRLATALIGTMAAVVLALLFASTRSSFEATNTSVGRMTTSVIELDHMLQEYGPEGQASAQGAAAGRLRHRRIDLAGRCHRPAAGGCQAWRERR